MPRLSKAKRQELIAKKERKIKRVYRPVKKLCQEINELSAYIIQGGPARESCIESMHKKEAELEAIKSQISQLRSEIELLTY